MPELFKFRHFFYYNIMELSIHATLFYNTKNINDMKYRLIAIIIVGFSLLSCSRKYDKSNKDSYVEVVGKAEKEVDPDIFYLGFTLSETNGIKKGSLAAMEQKVLAALQSLGIDVKNDLSVTNMSGYSWYWWRRNRNVEQTKNYELKATNLELLNKVCDKFDSIGSMNYNLNRIDYSGIDEVRKEVQQEAVKNARIKAENLLSGEDSKVDKLIYLQEREPQITYPRYGVQYERSADKASEQSQPSIDFKKMKVTYDIVARFSIE